MESDKWYYPGGSEWAKSMNEHEPTRSYGQEIYDFIKMVYGGYGSNIKALEIGAAWGVSAFAILMGSEGIKLSSVDKNLVDHTIAEINDSPYRDRWSFIQSNSAKYWETQKDKEPNFDFIYVDGSHKYEDVKNDLFNAWDHLVPGGYLMLDDFTHPANQKVDSDGDTVEYGVSLAAWELLKEKRNEFQGIELTTRLLVIRKS